MFKQGASNGPIFPDTPTEYCRNSGKRYGIDDFQARKLRHSFASIAITDGADIVSVSGKIGHSDRAVMLRMYPHADGESRKRVSEVFRNAMKKKTSENT